VEKDESVSRSYLSELQNITLHLNEAEQRLMRGIQTPPPSRLSGDITDNTVQIAEQEVSLSEGNKMKKREIINSKGGQNDYKSGNG